MGQRRSRLDRHAAELLALRRAGATVAQLTRWLRLRRGTVVAATTVRRWLENAPVRGVPDVDVANHFDVGAALDAVRARDRALRFPRLAVSSIDEHGHHVLRLRREGATIGECHRALRDEHGLRVDRSTVSRWLRRHANGEA
jgi:intein-encoded DNA endonuclease-like protein